MRDDLSGRLPKEYGICLEGICALHGCGSATADSYRFLMAYAAFPSLFQLPSARYDIFLNLETERKNDHV